MNKDYRILSVQRLSDGEIFSVGDALYVYEDCEYKRIVDEIVVDESYEGGLAVCEKDEHSTLNMKSMTAITMIKKAK